MYSCAIGHIFEHEFCHLGKKKIKHFSNRIEKLHKMAFIIFFFLKKLKKEATTYDLNSGFGRKS